MSRATALTAVAVGVVAMSLLSACGSIAGTGDDGASREVQGLECKFSNCPGVFYRGDQLLPFNLVDLDGGHAMAPAVCATPSNGFVAVSVDTSNQYRVLQFNANTVGPSWDVYDSGYTWSSKPACAQIESTTFNGQPGFIVVGKGSDNTLHNADGEMAPNSYPQANPQQIEIDEQISTATYSAGSPGVASSQDSSGNGLVIVAIVDDQQTLNIYTKPFPVLWEYWSSVIKGPKLPSGWSAIGAPAITSEPNNKWAVVAHARNTSSTDAIFRTVVTASYSGTPAFSSSWTQLGGSITGQMDDDPALTWDGTLSTETLFIRQGNATIHQTSGPLGFHPLAPILLNSWDWIASGPAAASDPYDMGNYVVLARGFDNHIYLAETIQEGNLKP